MICCWGHVGEGHVGEGHVGEGHVLHLRARQQPLPIPTHQFDRVFDEQIHAFIKFFIT